MIQSVSNDITKLKQDALLELFVLDASAPEIGAGVVMHMCNFGQTDGSSVLWQGQAYEPFPVMIDGVEMAAGGAGSQPTLSIGNVTGIFSVLCVNYKDLVGATVTRKRVLVKYLDGASGANPNAGLPDDVWYIEQKKQETKNTVTWTLNNPLDLDRVQIPRMRVNSSFCQVPFYRGPECSYTSTSIMTDRTGSLLTPTTDRGVYSALNSYAVGDFFYILYQGTRFYYVCIATAAAGIPLTNITYFKSDVCTRMLTSGCSARFGANNPLPFLAFPGTAKLPR